jgi:hemoglobin/transferrin/lactoferrin receptor protein
MVLSAVCAPFASAGVAQTAPEAAAPAGGATVDTVTVTATRNPTATLQYPGMVDVLSAGDIQTLIPSTISDLVRDMPNVQFVGGPRRTGESPDIRGLGGQDVLILVDGVRQSWTSGHDGRFFLDPALLTSVEVVRGPASALYGSGALGGAMSFRTADAADLLAPGQSVGARVSLGYQGVDDEVLRTLTGYTHVGNLDLVGSIGERSSGDIKLGSGASLAADDDIVTGFVKAGYDFGQGLRVKVSYQGFRNDAVEPDDGEGLTTGAPVDKTVTSQQISGEIDWKPAFASFIDLHLTPYHLQTSVREVDPATLERTLRDIRTDGVSVDNRTAFSTGALKGLLTIGGEWYQDKQTGSDSRGAGGTRSGVPDGMDSFWGIFAQVEAGIDRPLGAPGKLTVIPAIRYDSYGASSPGNADTSKTAVSPKFAATYAPVDWALVFGNVGKAFRAPGINDLYLTGVHFTVPHPILPGVSVANTFEPNPDLRPEQSRYWEAGAGFNFHHLATSNDTLRIKASYWNQRVDDFINLAVFTPPTFYSPGCFTPPTFLQDCNVGTTSAVNVNAALHGVELETVYDTSRLRLRLDYGTITGRERGAPYDLASLMPARLTTVVTLKVPEAAASLNARVEVAGGFDKVYDPASSDPSTETRPGYTLLDLYATWAPGDHILNGRLRGFRLDAGVDNVTDQNYQPYQAGVSAPGRNLKMLASYALAW